MKYTLLSLMLLLVACHSFGQSDKDIRKNKIKSVTTWLTETENGKTVTYKDSYELYDRSGNLITDIRYGSDGSITKKQTARFDKNSNVTEECEYDSDDVLKSRKTYAYNKLQKKTEEAEYGGAGKLLRKTAITYNPAGEKDTEVTTDAAGTVVKKVTYSYNGKNLRMQRKTSNWLKKSESVKKWEYEYY